MPSIVSIARYPVKGFPPEVLSKVDLVARQGFPGDRLFAFENGPSGFDAAAPEHIAKIKYLQTMRNPALWGLSLAYDPATRRLVLSREGTVLATGAADDASAIEAALDAALPGQARGPLKLIEGRGWQFMDSRSGHVSIIARATLDALSERAGVPLDARRFRANVIVDGLAPFAEFGLVGSRLRMGSALLDVTKRIDRCRAVDANPDTGRHDTDLVGLLERAFGHHDVGVYASVASGGPIAVGDTLSVIPGGRDDAPLGRADLAM